MSRENAPPEIEIRISRGPEGVEVWQGNRTTGPLCPGECIEQVIALLYPGAAGIRPGGYSMKSREEWEQRRPKASPRSWQSRLLSWLIAFGPATIGSILGLLLIFLAFWAGGGAP